MSAVRKWKPTHTRASMISLIAAEKRLKLLVEFERLLKALNDTLSVPKKFCSVFTTAPLIHVWPDGCSGNGGVASSGVQFGSATVSGFPSLSASWIAVIGRQKFQEYLSFQHAIA